MSGTNDGKSPTVDAARETFAGNEGVIAGAHDGMVIIEMNTFPLAIVLGTRRQRHQEVILGYSGISTHKEARLKLEDPASEEPINSARPLPPPDTEAGDYGGMQLG